MRLAYGLMEITHDGESPLKCADSLCSRYITNGQKCFVDVQSPGGSSVYCELCGTCERYHRKKESQR